MRYRVKRTVVSAQTQGDFEANDRANFEKHKKTLKKAFLQKKASPMNFIFQAGFWNFYSMARVQR